MPLPTSYYDLAVVGAGPVGLALAGWLARRSATCMLSTALIDARDARAQQDDPRALAVSHGSRVLLEPLGWPRGATLIERIHVSQRGHFGRTLIDCREHALPALGHVVRYDELVRALAVALPDTPHWLRHTSASSMHQDADGVTLTLTGQASKRTLRVRLLIHAEGGLYRPEAEITEMAANGPQPRDYGQTALVGMVAASAPQAHTAWERFTREGPVALLPLGGARAADYALVWCGTPGQAARRAALPDAALLAELSDVFGERLGRFTAISGRATFPLGLKALDPPVDRRVAAIGNAAQTLHPVAGQGLNLGLRDAHTLLEALASHGATPAALRDFARRRAFDRRVTIGLTDVLARAFTHDFGPLPLLRGLALAALDFAPPLKTALTRQMIFGQRR